jgi:outer membrane protein OmpA-like peptidoglycan-associated protein
MKKAFIIGCLVAAVAASGCATKSFVRDRVGEVNNKVETLSQSLEQTQEAVRKNEQRIGQAEKQITAVDQKAAAAGQSASAAQTAANNAAVKTAELEKATKRLIYEVTLSEDQGNFQFGKTDLPAEAVARLDAIAQQLKENPNGAFIEVEGHTDSIGSAEVNHRIGLQRAESVKRYLHEKHQIPLHKINVISYGPDRPVAPNNTRDGRAKNRRVVIRVVV